MLGKARKKHERRPKLECFDCWGREQIYDEFYQDPFPNLQERCSVLHTCISPTFGDTGHRSCEDEVLAAQAVTSRVTHTFLYVFETNKLCLHALAAKTIATLARKLPRESNDRLPCPRAADTS